MDERECRANCLQELLCAVRQMRCEEWVGLGAIGVSDECMRGVGGSGVSYCRCLVPLRVYIIHAKYLSQTTATVTQLKLKQL